MPSINYLRTVCSLGPERVRVFLNYRLKLISLGLPLDPAVAHHAMEGDGGEFQDWELLPNSETTLLNSLDNLSCFEEGIKPDSDGIKPDSDGIIPDSDGIIPDSDGIIRSDYFSIHNHNEGGFPNSTVASSTKDDPSDQGSVEFDNPSWIDPGSDTRYATNNPPESWPDSSSDRSDCRPFTDFDANNEFGFLEDVKIQLGSERAEQIHFGDVGNGSNSSIVSSESERGYEISAAVDAIANDEQVNSNAKSDAEQGENRAVIWWKVPFVVFKYYVVRISSPVWTFSVAAAVVGFVILGRKLYKMKRKSQSLQLKVTMDDNKVSQFMSRAARLNEAFSVVKRVPIVCPSLPAAGVTLWPVMSLR